MVIKSVPKNDKTGIGELDNHALYLEVYALWKIARYGDPNIVKVNEILKNDDTYWIISEFIGDGVSMTKFID